MSKNLNKKDARLRRATRGRMQAKRLGKPRLSVYRTPQHIYAQVILPEGGKVMAAASTVEKILKEGKASQKGKIDIAKKVGELIAKRAIEAGIREVTFDRSGFKYHGRIAALADAARQGGLQF